MGQTNEEMNINHIRLCKEHINLCDEESCAQLDYQIRAAAESAPPHMWERYLVPQVHPGNISIASEAVKGSRCISTR